MSALIVLGELISSMQFVLSSGDSDGGWLLLAGPVVGGGTYWGIYRYYRNTDKSHQFERTTRIESQPVTGSDIKFDEVHGTSRSKISGDNRKKHRDRVTRLQ